MYLFLALRNGKWKVYVYQIRNSYIGLEGVEILNDGKFRYVVHVRPNCVK